MSLAKLLTEGNSGKSQHGFSAAAAAAASPKSDSLAAAIASLEAAKEAPAPRYVFTPLRSMQRSVPDSFFQALKPADAAAPLSETDLEQATHHIRLNCKVMVSQKEAMGLAARQGGGPPRIELKIQDSNGLGGALRRGLGSEVLDLIASGKRTAFLHGIELRLGLPPENCVDQKVTIKGWRAVGNDLRSKEGWYQKRISGLEIMANQGIVSLSLSRPLDEEQTRLITSGYGPDVREALKKDIDMAHGLVVVRTDSPLYSECLATRQWPDGLQPHYIRDDELVVFENTEAFNEVLEDIVHEISERSVNVFTLDGFGVIVEADDYVTDLEGKALTKPHLHLGAGLTSGNNGATANGNYYQIQADITLSVYLAEIQEDQ